MSLRIKIKSEQSVEGDLGILLDSKHFSVDIAAYNNHINNFIYLGLTADSVRGYPFTGFTSLMPLRGIEAEVIYNLRKWLSFRNLTQP